MELIEKYNNLVKECNANKANTIHMLESVISYLQEGIAKLKKPDYKVEVCPPKQEAVIDEDALVRALEKLFTTTWNG